MTPDHLTSRLRAAAILPILTVRQVSETLRTVEALAAAGVSAIEIVLRTPDAPEAIRAVRARFPELTVAAGTVTSPASLDAAVVTGADLVISPGLPAALAAHHRGCAVPLLPGAFTATEVLEAANLGYRTLKYYPAVPSNGHVMLEDYANLFPDIAFVPTGKISLETLPLYAKLKNVLCVGGSWMHAGDPAGIADKVARSFAAVEQARQ